MARDRGRTRRPGRRAPPRPPVDPASSLPEDPLAARADLVVAIAAVGDRHVAARAAAETVGAAGAKRDPIGAGAGPDPVRPGSRRDPVASRAAVDRPVAVGRALAEVGADADPGDIRRDLAGQLRLERV